MGILSKAFSPSNQKSGVLADLIRAAGGSGSSRSVSVTTAIQVSTVYACLRVLGEGVAQVPLKLMKADGRTRLPAKDHPLYEILSVRPNDWQTSFEYREMLVWHAGLCGNHFSFINRGSGGKILELIPFTPNQVTVKRANDWTLSYEVTGKDGARQIFPAESIWHVRGPSWDGWNGLEAVKLARQAIGLAMSIEDSTSNLHKNSVLPSGVYSVEGTLNADGYKSLRKWIDEHHAGPQNLGKPLILDRAAKWVSMQMSGVDAQTYETRRFQIEEICRFCRVMPIMVGHADKSATYASAEQMFLAHVVHTLAPWYERIEQSISVNLLTEKDRVDGFYPNFVEEALLRGSAKDTKDALLGYVNGGLMYANEAREKLDLNPDPDPNSDKLRIPANITGLMPEENSEDKK